MLDFKFEAVKNKDCAAKVVLLDVFKNLDNERLVKKLGKNVIEELLSAAENENFKGEGGACLKTHIGGVPYVVLVCGEVSALKLGKILYATLKKYMNLEVVSAKVFDAGAHAVFLHATHISGSCLAGHERVLRIVFEIASAQRVALYVKRWSQQHVGTIGFYLFADGLSHLFNELLVPCRGKQCADGEVGAIISCFVVGTCGVDAQTGRAVSQHDGGQA